MENSFINSLKDIANYKYTENGGVAHKTTRSAIYDMFALGGAYRNRSKEDCILLFKNALEENESLAMKCLFYLRDVTQGQGERRFFRVCYKWLCDSRPEVAQRNLKYLAEFGRWDDVLYTTDGTKLEHATMELIKNQLNEDLGNQYPSLLGKWLPSENASSYNTKKMATKVRRYLKLTHKKYRKILSELRCKINIVERLMSENRWEEIEFDKIPSKAGLIYKDAFARRDLIKEKYKDFIQNEKTTVNAKTLYPYDIVKKVTKGLDCWGDNDNISQIDRDTIEKYWYALPDYTKGKDRKCLCVCDTSGSMCSSYYSSIAPIDIAISLSMYCAERLEGPFKNNYISFASQPQLISIEGIDFVDKVERIYKTNLCDNTNLVAVFDLLKKIALQPTTNINDLPDTIIVISDMEIDSGSSVFDYRNGIRIEAWTQDSAATEMEKIREEWAAADLKMPKLVYWNVDARSNTILDYGPNVSFVSGCSPVILEQILQGITGMEIMLKKLNSNRYKCIE